MSRTPVDISQLDEYGLRQQCEALGLSTAGNSSVLRSRLRRHFEGGVPPTPAKQEVGKAASFGAGAPNGLGSKQRQDILGFLATKWEAECFPVISEYIRVPNQSPSFDPEWESNGLMDSAMDLLEQWALKQRIPGMAVRRLKQAKRTPLLVVTIPATAAPASRGSAARVPGTVMMYGHMDKQPPLTSEWAPGLGPYVPVVRDGKLYGRGGADDGYSIFTAITSVQALQSLGIPHGRIFIIIEASEESGSPDLPFWMDEIGPELGTPDLIVCLDSGALSYEQLWVTSSLRGLVNGPLTVRLLKHGIHSGMGGGLAPCTFRILRQLLSRIENEATGEVTLKELHAPIPEYVQQQMEVINSLGKNVMVRDVPFVEGARGF
eukprot:RCo018867